MPVHRVLSSTHSCSTHTLSQNPTRLPRSRPRLTKWVSVLPTFVSSLCVCLAPRVELGDSLQRADHRAYHPLSGQVAILFPPAAAAFITGCSCDLLINICLTMCVCDNRAVAAMNAVLTVILWHL